MWRRIPFRPIGFALLVTAFLGLAIGAPVSVRAQDAEKKADGGVGFPILHPEARNDPTPLFFKPTCNMRLDGAIWGADPDKPGDQGDAVKAEEALKEFLAEAAEHGPLPAGHFYALCLSSPGGDLREAVKIAQVFAGWMMVVEAGAICESACAVIFMSAPPRDRVFSFSPESPGRFLHVRGTLGFHLPALNHTHEEAMARLKRAREVKPEELEGLARELAEDFKATYRKALERTRDVAFFADPANRQAALTQSTDWFLGKGLHVNAMPPELLMSFLTTPNAGVFHVRTLIEAMSWGIEIYGMAPPRELSESLMRFACINVAAVQCLHTPEGECYDKFQSIQGGRGAAGVLDAVIDLDLAFKALALMIAVTPGAEATQLPYLSAVRREFPPVKPENVFRLLASGLQEPAPLLGQSEIYHLRLRQEGRPPAFVCDIRAAWDDDNRVAELHIDLVAQKHDNRQALLYFTGGPEIFARSLNRKRLRPWKLLPGLTPLRDIGAGKGFEEYGTGERFFGKPANW